MVTRTVVQFTFLHTSTGTRNYKYELLCVCVPTHMQLNKNIILHNKFLSYKLLEINNNYIYLIKFISLILHLILILIPLYYINKYKYYNKINIYKSLLISLLILLAYSILIYPKSITSIYLLY
jgi:uncharacterized membrane protein YagU involved in acid resistance